MSEYHVDPKEVNASLNYENNQGREWHFQVDYTIGSRMYHVRFDDFNDFKQGVRDMESMLPSTESFPEDSGPKAQVATEPKPPVCPVHGVEMKMKPAGVSKTSGKSYPAFWSCPERNADGSYCRAKPNKDVGMDTAVYANAR